MAGTQKTQPLLSFYKAELSSLPARTKLIPLRGKEGVPASGLRTGLPGQPSAVDGQGITVNIIGGIRGEKDRSSGKI